MDVIEVFLDGRKYKQLEFVMANLLEYSNKAEKVLRDQNGLMLKLKKAFPRESIVHDAVRKALMPINIQ